MRYLQELKESLHSNKKGHDRWQKAIAALMAVVVFCTTYSLILPAITLDVQTAEAEPGIEAGLYSGGYEEEVSGEAEASAPAVSDADTGDMFQYGEGDLAASDADTSAEAPAQGGAAGDMMESETAGTGAVNPGAGETDTAQTEIRQTEQGQTDSANTETETERQTTPAVAQTLKASGSDYTVTAVCSEESGVPAGAKLKVSEIKPGSSSYDEYLETAREAIGETDETMVSSQHARFFDIIILADGQKIEPEAGVEITIAFHKPVSVDHLQEVKAVHFGEDGVEIVDADAEQNAKGVKEISFTADSFSVYGVVYTVDFHWEVDGKMYDFSIPGGGYVSLSELVEVLGITISDNNPENQGNNTGNGSDNDAQLPGEMSVADNVVETEANLIEDANSDETDTKTAEEVTEALESGNIEISDKTREFVANVESITFSNPEYLWVGKVKDEPIVWYLMEKYDLHPFYPEDMTEQEYVNVVTTNLTPDDWALISLEPFSSAETLTIKLKNGKEIAITVTDEQNAQMTTDSHGNEIVDTITNPAGTTFDVFDYWIVDQNKQGRSAWPGHDDSKGPFSYDYDGYDFDGNPASLWVPDYNQPTEWDRSGTPTNWKYVMSDTVLRGNGNNQGINTDHAFKFSPSTGHTVLDGTLGTPTVDGTHRINSYTGNADPTVGLVTGTLVNGYPKLTNDSSLGTNGESLAYLFDGSSHAGKARYSGADHLLYVDPDGYYTYDSRDYWASFDTSSKDFTLTKQTSDNTEIRGFWPFGDRQYWVGMHMNTQFSMPTGGQVLNPKGVYKDMEFEFSGDDDTWLYIDGVLVGDGGGIHNRTDIKINFKTGLVTVTGTEDTYGHAGTYTWTKYLDEIFRDAGRSTDDFDGHTFKEGTYHTFDMFYLERGGGESNLFIRYNLVSTADFTGHKEYHGETGNERLLRNQFKFDLIGLDGQYDASGNLIGGKENVRAIMPVNPNNIPENVTTNPAETDAGTVEKPLYLENTTTPILEGDEYVNHNSQTYRAGVTEDGNINFGSAVIPEEYIRNYDPNNPAIFHYVVREYVPDTAVNASGKTWAASSEAERREGGYVLNNITYDGTVYYMSAAVTRWQATDSDGNPKVDSSGNPVYQYGLSKRYFTDDTYTTQLDENHRFINFDNRYMEPLTLKINKKGEENKKLPGADFKLSRAAFDEETSKWNVIAGVEPMTGTTDTNGQLKFENLSAGNYILEETKAPDGYKDASNKWLVTLTRTDTVTGEGENAVKKSHLEPTITLLNKDGSVPAGATAQKKTVTNHEFEHEILNEVKPPFELTVEKHWSGIDNPNTNDVLRNSSVKVTLGRYKVTEKAGNFKIQKTINVDYGTPDFSAKYYIRGTDAAGNERVYGPYSISGANEARGSIAPGTYKVYEENISADGAYSWTHNSEPVDLVITDGQDGNPTPVTFTSKANMKIGSLKITSSLVPGNSSVSFSGVKYTVLDGSGNRAKDKNGHEIADIRYSSIENGYYVDDLKIGNYTVVESGLPNTPPGYRLVHTPNGKDRVSAAVVEGGREKAAEAKFESEYEQSEVTNYYSVKKYWNGNLAQDGDYINKSGSFDVAEGDRVKFIMYLDNSGWDRTESSEHWITPKYNGNSIQSSAITSYQASYKNASVRAYSIEFVVAKDATLEIGVNASNSDWKGYEVEKVAGQSSAGAPRRPTLASSTRKVISVGTETVRPASYGTDPTDLLKNYEVDASFSKEVTLNQSGEWKWQEELPTTDDQGNKYYYYIKEVVETNMPTGTTCTIQLDGGEKYIVGEDFHVDGEGNPLPLIVTNTVVDQPETGSLKITKSVTVDGNPITEAVKGYADGTYTFVIEKDDTPISTGKVNGTEIADGKVSITIENGVAATVEVTDLAPGEYTIEEETPSNGTTLTKVGDTAITAESPAAAKVATVTVTAGKSGDDVAAEGIASFTNNAETISLKVKKEWAASTPANKKKDVTFEVWQRVFVEDDGERIEVADRAYKTGIALPADGTEVSVSNLPTHGMETYNDSNSIVVYDYHIEENVPDGFFEEYRDGQNAGEVIILNTPYGEIQETTDVSIQKKWVDLDNNDASNDHKEDQISFTLTKTKIRTDCVQVNVVYKDGNGDRYGNVQTFFVTKGTKLNFTISKPETPSDRPYAMVSVNGEEKGRLNGTNATTKVISTGSITKTADIVVSLRYDGNSVRAALNKWGPEAKREDIFAVVPRAIWSSQMTLESGTGVKYDTAASMLEEMDKVNSPDERVSVDSSTYTMKLEAGADGKLKTVVAGADDIFKPDENVNWSAVAKGLPRLERAEDGTYYAYRYSISELNIIHDGSTEPVTYDKNDPSKGESKNFEVTIGKDGVITNKEKERKISLEILKVDSTAQTVALENAEFSLKKIEPDATSMNMGDKSTSVGSGKTDKDGKLSFASLGYGYYELSETKAPLGYIFEEDTIIYFHVDKNDVKLLQKPEDKTKAIKEWAEGKSCENVLSFRFESDTATANLKISNTPGAALPHTGGPGTTLTYLLGIMLTGLAGAGLAMRRRRREAA